TALDPIQKTLKKLEFGGLLSSYKEGRTRVFVWNPRYPFLGEIKALAKKVYEFTPEDQKEKFYLSKTRRRPRKTDKPI
ncbi:MAG: ArsR family transcriptional regulator, partial [Chlamydiota bacterium]